MATETELVEFVGQLIVDKCRQLGITSQEWHMLPVAQRHEFIEAMTKQRLQEEISQSLDQHKPEVSDGH